MEMSNREIGDMIRKLRRGEAVHCPQCENGIISPQKSNEVHFQCTECDFMINLEKK